MDKEWFQIQIKSLEEKLDRRNDKLRRFERRWNNRVSNTDEDENRNTRTFTYRFKYTNTTTDDIFVQV